MTSLIILLLVGGACLAVAAWAILRTPQSRESIKRFFGAGGGGIEALTGSLEQK